MYVAGVSSGMVGTNYTDELKAMGLSVPGALLQLWDFTGGVGGPIKRDRLWYFLNLRNQGSHSSVPSMFANKNAGDATKWTYEADTTRQSRSAANWSIVSLRLTAQATPRNKFNVWDEQKPCNAQPRRLRPRVPPAVVRGRLHLRRQRHASPETATYENRYQRVQQLTWQSPMTNRIFVQAGYGNYKTSWGGDELPGSVTRSLVRVTEQCAPSCAGNGGIANLTYRSGNWASHYMGQHNWNGSLSYVTGAHNMKFGYQGTFYADDEQYFTNDEKVAYRVNNAVPNLITLPPLRTRKLRTRYNALYAQSNGRLTDDVAGRGAFDHAWSYFLTRSSDRPGFLPTPIVYPQRRA